jgi:hypothetical protein
MSAQEQQVDVGWQSRQPVRRWGALCAAVLFFAGMLWAQYAFAWSGLQRYCLPIYMKTAARAWQSPQNRADYVVLYIVNKRSQQRLALPDEVETAHRPDGQTGYQLTDAALAAGCVRLTFEIMSFNDAGLHAWLASSVHGNRTLADELKLPGFTALLIFVVLAYFAGLKDRERSIALLRGQRLDGTESTSAAGFNPWMRRRKKINGERQDGVVFLDAAQTWLGHIRWSHTY